MGTTLARGKPGEDEETSRAGKNIDINKIISRMHRYRTDLGGFVDREEEAREILNWSLGKPVQEGMITVLYGPNGCGKSMFFRVLSGAADHAGAGLDVLVIERRRDIAQGYKIYFPRGFKDVARSIEKYLSESISILSNKVFIGLATTPTYAAYKISAYIAYRLLS